MDFMREHAGSLVGGTGATGAVIMGLWFLFKHGISEWWEDRRAERLAALQARLNRNTGQDRLNTEVVHQLGAQAQANLELVRQELRERKETEIRNLDVLDRLVKAVEVQSEGLRQTGDSLKLVHNELIFIRGAMSQGKLA